MVVIVDIGIGNVRSLKNMFRSIGVDARISSSPAHLYKASHLVFPGNGAYDACINALNESNLRDTINSCVFDKKVPFLGICVGAQMMGMGSEEGKADGFGWIDFEVKRIPSNLGYRVPHMGWNELIFEGKNTQYREILSQKRFYFIHSYFMDCSNSENIVASCEYGVKFCAVVQKENIMGVQFHPEKSHDFGKSLLKEFVKSK